MVVSFATVIIKVIIIIIIIIIIVIIIIIAIMGDHGKDNEIYNRLSIQ